MTRATNGAEEILTMMDLRKIAQFVYDEGFAALFDSPAMTSWYLVMTVTTEILEQKERSQPLGSE